MLAIVSILSLCSCAVAPLQISSNGTAFASGPTSLDDPRLHSPQFYMNDDTSPSVEPGASAPFQFGSVDNFCAANCQAHHYSAAYCTRACNR